MKFSPADKPCTGLRFVAVSVMFCAFLVYISAMDDSLTEGPRRRDPKSKLASSDGAETGEKQSLLYRERRVVKKNATPNLTDFEKRLKAVEER